MNAHVFVSPFVGNGQPALAFVLLQSRVPYYCILVALNPFTLHEPLLHDYSGCQLLECLTANYSDKCMKLCLHWAERE